MSFLSSFKHYTSTPLKKMGRWSLLPADTETWMTEETSKFFCALFGIPKGILNICTLDDGMMQNYVPENYITALYKHIHAQKQQDMHWLEKKLKTFYTKRSEAELLVSQLPKNLSSLSNEELIQYYTQNRTAVHELSAFDQFGWITEEAWETDLRRILLEVCKLQADSETYHQVLFALTKPERISTTQQERLAVLQAALGVKHKSTSVQEASQQLADTFGWMPVFTYGTAWDASWYQKQLLDLSRKSSIELENLIKDISLSLEQRAHDISVIQKTYQLSDADLQTFFDFALTLDTRNEAEFFVSFAGFHLQRLYQEIAKRLRLNISEVRMLFEYEIIQSLRNQINPHSVLESKGGIVAWGFDLDMQHRFNLTGQEAKMLFSAVEQRSSETASLAIKKGVCASPGSAQGRARILLSPKDNDRVEYGDILITVATTVDFLPAMQRAAAIITEVGGLTCHAAVVSRELGLPCIVSHKHATTLFKDGDWLEIDANRAIITKIT